ncbi:hypothetical protein HAX54_046889 [Datura stramonium]|uniref:Uncharacterized protein n=1 Tax=Datura stramonium TaxID=4076 RepID=A0ABS8WHN9_DATST|nr:hypothetical protein [Datura stramonium]
MADAAVHLDNFLKKAKTKNVLLWLQNTLILDGKLEEFGPLYLDGRTEYVFNVDFDHLSIPELVDYAKDFGLTSNVDLGSSGLENIDGMVKENGEIKHNGGVEKIDRSETIFASENESCQ